MDDSRFYSSFMAKANAILGDMNQIIPDLEERCSNPLATFNVKDELKAYVDSFRKCTSDIPSVRDVLHPDDDRIDLLPDTLRKLYASYEALYGEAYELQRSRLVAPEDKEAIRIKALDAGRKFRDELANALGIKGKMGIHDVHSEMPF